MTAIKGIMNKLRPFEIVSGLAAHGRAASALGVGLSSVREVGARRTWEMFRNETGTVADIQTAVYRDIWGKAIADIGAASRELPGGTIQIERDGHETRVLRALIPLDDPVSLQIAGDKVSTHELLAEGSIPVPAHLACGIEELDAATEFLRAHGRIVVKPARLTAMGSGVTGAVRTRRDLLKARLRAGRYDARTLLLEEHLLGHEYRFLVLAGECIGAVHRRPPTVVGNGRDTVLALIGAENRRRSALGPVAGYRRITVDLDTVLTLREQRLDPRSTPESGRTVVVSSSTSQGSERDARTIAIAAPELDQMRDLAAASAKCIGLELAGVEFIVPNDNATDGCVKPAVIEVNATPGIAHHYIVDNAGEHPAVGPRILEHLLG